MDKRPRIGRQVDHYDMVDTDSIEAIFSNDMSCRYTLKLKYKSSLDSKRDKTATVILKNPSSADEKRSDKTIRNVEKFVYERLLDVEKLNILNILSLRGTDAKEIGGCIDRWGLAYGVGEDNDLYFEELIPKSDYIIIAWGRNNGIKKQLYDKRVESVFEMIKRFNKKALRMDGKGSDFYPFHACFWGSKYNFIEAK